MISLLQLWPIQYNYTNQNLYYTILYELSTNDTQSALATYIYICIVWLVYICIHVIPMRRGGKCIFSYTRINAFVEVRTNTHTHTHTSVTYIRCITIYFIYSYMWYSYIILSLFLSFFLSLYTYMSLSILSYIFLSNKYL